MLSWDRSSPFPSVPMAATASLSVNQRINKTTALPDLLLTEATPNYISQAAIVQAARKTSNLRKAKIFFWHENAQRWQIK